MYRKSCSQYKHVSLLLAAVYGVFKPLFLRYLIGGTGIDSGGARSSRKTRSQVSRKHMKLIGARARFVEVTWGEAGKNSPVDYLDSRVTQMTPLRSAQCWSCGARSIRVR